MPRLITRRKKLRKVPPCRRLIVYVRPHSPFQKLVESARFKAGTAGKPGRPGKSIKDLAEEISELTPNEPALNPGSLWIWLRNVNGFPHPKSATKGRLRALARVLRIPLPRLEEALDASRHLFTARERPQPVESLSAIDSLIEIIKNDKRTYLSKSKILNLAEMMRGGSLES